MNPELSDILSRNTRFARFCKVNLHVHTPATPWNWNQYNKSKDTNAGKMTPKDVAEALVETDLDVVAVTDHDTVGWYKDIKREVQKLLRGKDRSLTVLLGVEITTYDRVHLLAVFAPDVVASDVTDLLKLFGLKGDGVRSESANDNWPLAKIVSELDSRGALIVAPHAEDPRLGIWGGTKSEHKGKRKDWLELDAIRILACRPDRVEKLRQALKTAGIKREFSFLAHSDAHRLADLGSDATWIKFAEPSVEGLRQVIHEPDLRVSYERPAAAKHPRILAVSIDGGYFEDQTLVFSPHLNTLIGGNHAGKSAIVDSIRYAFDDHCYRVEKSRRDLNERIAGIVTDGVVRCWFVGTDGASYRVERRALFNSDSGPLRSAVRPIVTRLDGDVEIPVTEDPLTLLPMDIYGQGAVGQISRYTEHRDLIDSMAGTLLLSTELDPSSEDPSDLLQKWRSNLSATQETQDQITGLRARLEELPKLQEQSRQLEGQARSDVFASWKEWDKARRSVKKADKAVTEIESELSRLVAQGLRKGSIELAKTVRPEVTDQLEPVRAAVVSLERVAKSNLNKLRIDVTAAIKVFRMELEKWESAWREENQRRREHLAKLGLSSERALHDKLGELGDAIDELEKTTKPERDRLSVELSRLEEERAELTTELDRFWEFIRETRRQTVDRLNDRTGPDLLIEFVPEVDHTALTKLLDQLLTEHTSRGAYIQKRQREIGLLVRAFSAVELSLLLVHGVPEKLVKKAGVTDHTAEVLCGLPVSAKLDVAFSRSNDSVTIKFRREGESQHSNLERVSGGERSLALLMVAFANDKGPILIDQPEDELGQLLVTSELVETIRRSKQSRQFVVVTHNANIPVLGDAEGIFCIKNTFDPDAKARRCFVDNAGALECAPVKEVLLGLEGGQDSFRRRQAKYNIAAT